MALRDRLVNLEKIKMTINKINILVTGFLLLTFPDTRSQSLNTPDCEVKSTVSSIPNEIRKAIKSKYHSRTTLASPEENFQSTDVVGKKRLKERRLALWAKCGDDFYLVYEHGGYGYHKHAIVVTKSGKDFIVVKNIAVGKAVKTIDEVKEAVKLDSAVSLDHF